MTVKYVNAGTQMSEYKGWACHFLAGSSWASYFNFSLFAFLIFCLFVCFYFHYSRRWIKKDLAAIYVKECSSYVFL